LAHRVERPRHLPFGIDYLGLLPSAAGIGRRTADDIDRDVKSEATTPSNFRLRTAGRETSAAVLRIRNRSIDAQPRES
jgi:hypothetical protein